MNHKILYVILIPFISCVSSPGKPMLKEQGHTYRFVENKYALFGDSVAGFKSIEKFYNLEFERDSNNIIAVWKELFKVPSGDTSQLMRLLSSEYEEGFTAKFRLLETGMIDSLMNWSDLKLFVDSLTLEYYKYYGFSSDDVRKIEPYLRVKQSKGRLVSTQFKGPYAFHNFFGIDATYSDTLVQNQFIMDMNGAMSIVDAEVKIEVFNDTFVDYVVSSNYKGNNDVEMITEFERMAENTDMSDFKEINLDDSIFYRYNRELDQLENIVIKRYLNYEAFKVVNEFELSLR